MRSRLTTVLTIAFLSLGTGGALALAGGQDLGLGGHDGHSASSSQYGHPPFPTPPVTPPGPPVSTPPVPTPPVRTPPASKFIPSAASVTLSTRGGATVRCPTACQIVLSVRRGSHRVRVKIRLRASGSAKIRLTKSELKRLGRGRAVVTVEVNGKQITQGTLRVK